MQLLCRVGCQAKLYWSTVGCSTLNTWVLSQEESSILGRGGEGNSIKEVVSERYGLIGAAGQLSWRDCVQVPVESQGLGGHQETAGFFLHFKHVE